MDAEGARRENNARCPRCGGGLRCGMNDPGPCACTQVTLDEAALAQLRARYRGCLCLPCLMALAQAADRSAR